MSSLPVPMLPTRLNFTFSARPLMSHIRLPTLNSPMPNRCIWAIRSTATSAPSTNIFTPTTQSCQIMMGMTLLEPGNMWNTMPAHLHARRMEVYLYFDIDDDNVVFHLMGEPNETRHLVMRDREAVISPSWLDLMPAWAQAVRHFTGNGWRKPIICRYG